MTPLRMGEKVVRISDLHEMLDLSINIIEAMNVAGHFFGTETPVKSYFILIFQLLSTYRHRSPRRLSESYVFIVNSVGHEYIR